ncbi:MAG: hypothetical protein U0166_10160 [Acidobacteriota bacterium]
MHANAERGDVAAERDHDRAAAIARRVGDRRLEGIVLGNKAILQEDAAQLVEASAARLAALAIARELGDRLFEGIWLRDLGGQRCREGAYGEAGDLLDQAERIFVDLDQKLHLGFTICEQGRLAQARGGSARDHVARSREIARTLGAGPDSALGGKIADLASGEDQYPRAAEDTLTP